MTLETQAAPNPRTDRKWRTVYLRFLCHIAAPGIPMTLLTRRRPTLNTLSGPLVPILPSLGLLIALLRLDSDPLPQG